jgi:hypothetical protein
MSGLDVESLHVEDSETYEIAGDPITLGSGGLVAAPATSTTEPIGSILALPISLGDPQVWTIEGQSNDSAIDGNQLLLLGKVSGANESLDMKVSDGGGLDLANDNEVGPLTLEGADPSRAGILNGVVELFGAQLDASDHEPVSLSHVFLIGTGATGSLRTDATEIFVVPGEKQPERLEVNGATLDPESRLTFGVTGGGSNAGLEYAQLRSTGSVDLDNAELAVAAEDSCKALAPGTVYTLVTSTGGIVGNFGDADESEEIPIEFPKGCTISQTLHIHYERTGGTQAVTGTVIAGPTSTTMLEASPAAPITNQTVTLTATVDAVGEKPSGRIAFADGGVAIPTCSNEALMVTGPVYTATCQVSFLASESPRQLTALFTPEPGLNLRGSSATNNLVVGLGPTTTTLRVSPATAPINESVGYIATVSNSVEGSVRPDGTVLFADGGVPIGSCSAEPLQLGAFSSLSAMCLISYPSSGTHNITASYSGDANFAASSSVAQLLTVEAPLEEPEVLVKAAPGIARLEGASISVHGLKVALVKLACKGSSGCKGKLTLLTDEVTMGKKGKKISRSVTIGSESFSIVAGKRASIEVRLSAVGQTLLKGHKMRLGATLKLAQGSTSTQTSVHLVGVTSNDGTKKG